MKREWNDTDRGNRSTVYSGLSGVMVGRWWGAQIIEKNTDNPKYILY
jgi:hypothetical protein